LVGSVSVSVGNGSPAQAPGAMLVRIVDGTANLGTSARVSIVTAVSITACWDAWTATP